MLIVKTPLRLSFLGGGIDYPVYLKNNDGMLFGTTIDKYSFISLRRLLPFFNWKSRFSYSAIETVHEHKNVIHRAIRACLEHTGFDEGIEFSHIADLPSGGTGSSAAFIVSLLNGINCLQGKYLSPKQLAIQSMYIEQEILKESTGKQDNIFAAYGGFNYIKFYKNEDFDVFPINLPTQDLLDFQKHLMLFYIKGERKTHDPAKVYVNDLIGKKYQNLRIIQKCADDGLEAIFNRNWIRFGELMDQAWRAKKDISTNISNPEIDILYSSARICGAIGGKITGADNNGLMILVVDPAKRKNVKEQLKNLIEIPFKFDFSGSKVIFHSGE